MDPATKKLATAGDTPPVEGAAASSAAASMEAERSAPPEEPQTPPPEYDWQKKMFANSVMLLKV